MLCMTASVNARGKVWWWHYVALQYLNNINLTYLVQFHQNHFHVLKIIIEIHGYVTLQYVKLQQ